MKDFLVAGGLLLLGIIIFALIMGDDGGSLKSVIDTNFDSMTTRLTEVFQVK